VASVMRLTKSAAQEADVEATRACSRWVMDRPRHADEPLRKGGRSEASTSLPALSAHRLIILVSFGGCRIFRDGRTSVPIRIFGNAVRCTPQARIAGTRSAGNLREREVHDPIAGLTSS